MGAIILRDSAYTAAIYEEVCDHFFQKTQLTTMFIFYSKKYLKFGAAEICKKIPAATPTETKEAMQLQVHFFVFFLSFLQDSHQKKFSCQKATAICKQYITDSVNMACKVLEIKREEELKDESSQYARSFSFVNKYPQPESSDKPAVRLGKYLGKAGKPQFVRNKTRRRRTSSSTSTSSSSSSSSSSVPHP